MPASFPAVPQDLVDGRQHRRLIASATNRLLDGKLNATGEITLTENVTSTDLDDLRLGPASLIWFDPLTANAASELHAGTMYVLEADRGQGAFTITHANAASTDRTFRYLIIG